MVFKLQKITKIQTIIKYSYCNPDRIGCIKRAGSTLHWVARLDCTTECVYRNCYTGTNYTTVSMGAVLTHGNPNYAVSKPVFKNSKVHNFL